MSENHFSLRHYLRVLRRQAWIVLVTVGLAIAVALLVTSQQPSVYRASMKVVVGQGGGVFQPEFSNATDTFTSTMTNLLKSEIVARTVIADLNLRITPKTLLKHLKISSKPLSSVLEISYTSPSRAESVTILSKVGSVFTTLVRVKLGTVAQPSRATPGQLQIQPISASVFDPAHAEPGRVAPRPARDTVVAGVLGLALGLVLAFLRESLDDRLRTRNDAEAWFGAPVSGTLPKGMRGQQPAALSQDGGRRQGHVLESLRLLGANLQFAHGGPAGPAILVTSALPEEGKTTVVANLGAMLAVAGHDVVVVDADLRRPRLSKYLGVDATEGGLVDVLQRSTDLDRALRTVPLAQAGRNGRILTRTGRPITKRAIVAGLATERAGRLRLLASGGPTDESASLLTPAAVEDLIQDLRARCEFVVFDAAPLLVVADSFPLALKSDTIIVVARQGRTTRQSAQSVRNTLSGLGATNVSVVITDGSRPSGYAYPYLR